MYSFLPQLLIIVSIAGILVILLRRVPGVQELAAKTPFRELPLRLWQVWGQKAWDFLVAGGKKFWQFLLEVKEVSRTKTKNLAGLSRTFSNLRLPKANLRIFKARDSFEGLLEEAQAAEERGAFEDAERKYIKLIEKDPKNEKAFAGLGSLYLDQKKYNEAVETYNFLLKAYPANDSYYSNLGRTYHSQKLYDRAIEAYEKSIELAPENPKRYINLGLTLEAKKHLEEAILNYRKAVDLEKNNTQFLLVLAEALGKKGDKEEAQVILEQILQLEPTNHLAREKLMQLKF